MDTALARHSLVIGTEAMEPVYKLTYLGSYVSETGETEEDIT